MLSEKGDRVSRALVLTEAPYMVADFPAWRLVRRIEKKYFLGSITQFTGTLSLAEDPSFR